MMKLSLITILLTLIVLVKCSSSKFEKQKLKVSLYYETLCPFCMTFINDQLYPGYQKLGDYLDLELIPYGNARRKKTDNGWTIECQHGPKECVYNKIEACGMARNVDQNAVISFVHCIEKGIKTDDSNYKRITKKCGPLLNVNTADIIKCAEGQEGDELMVANGVKTDAVQPSIDGVPTVLYNNYYNDTLEEYNDNFLTIACKLLDDEPAACMHLDNEIW
uniref:Saposin A-type domain-containing protein n=1 Tax=Photinus pyralis TaxID=7054 RepID=A0A1Y1MEY3_PHOPY